jgi:hypothetical protein
VGDDQWQTDRRGQSDNRLVKAAQRHDHSAHKDKPFLLIAVIGEVEKIYYDGDDLSTTG